MQPYENIVRQGAFFFFSVWIPEAHRKASQMISVFMYLPIEAFRVLTFSSKLSVSSQTPGAKPCPTMVVVDFQVECYTTQFNRQTDTTRHYTRLHRIKLAATLLTHVSSFVAALEEWCLYLFVLRMFFLCAMLVESANVFRCEGY